MTHNHYPSDVTDTQWAEMRALLAAPRGGRPRIYELRDIVDAILYVQRTGCPWRLLPHDLPPWRTVHYHLRRLMESGDWERATQQLQARKSPHPSRRRKSTPASPRE